MRRNLYWFLAAAILLAAVLGRSAVSALSLSVLTASPLTALRGEVQVPVWTGLTTDAPPDQAVWSGVDPGLLGLRAQLRLPDGSTLHCRVIAWRTGCEDGWALVFGPTS